MLLVKNHGHLRPDARVTFYFYVPVESIRKFFNNGHAYAMPNSFLVISAEMCVEYLFYLILCHPDPGIGNLDPILKRFNQDMAFICIRCGISEQVADQPR